MLREVAGRMRNIAIEKHRAPTDPSGPAVDRLIAEVKIVLAKPFRDATDVEPRRNELADALSQAAAQLAMIRTDTAAKHAERYRRWAERLTSV
ncbi:MAG: hypothetical protein AAF235_07335 [Planctomycetota bacterium]